jgi:nucleotide-binding universal stress UspA family protein
LAHHTTPPLLILPARGAAAPLDRIVLGVDGSSGSQGSVRWCARLAAGLDAEVFAVCALDPRAIWPPESSAAKTFMKKLRGDWLAPLHDVGVEVHPMITEGLPPVSALSAVAKDEDAGLLVVGTQGTGGFLGMRRDRLPVQLVHHAQIPVAIVPSPAGETNLL